MGRPEQQKPAECYYDEREARRYTQCSRIIDVQSAMAQRCLDLVDLGPGPALVLDLGCGSGLSGQVLSEAGHAWWGLDLSPDMLAVCAAEGAEGELVRGDLGQGFHLLPGFFDAAISVSAIQWLCNADQTGHDPWQRLLRLFASLQRALKATGRAALQFYPENAQQTEMVCNAAMRAGFAGGLYIDYPNSAAAKKYYLVLHNAVEGRLGVELRAGDGADEPHNVLVARPGSRHKPTRRAPAALFAVKSKNWVFRKKEKQRKQGRKVRKDTKYTGRKRKAQR